MGKPLEEEGFGRRSVKLDTIVISHVRATLRRAPFLTRDREALTFGVECLFRFQRKRSAKDGPCSAKALRSVFHLGPGGGKSLEQSLKSLVGLARPCPS